ncbi:JAB domain-containing protein [Solitalea lacus]|uniref:JAB domain-containing protein n=1 Tax=Solitalea lacus TaxID=2911172 RepID=UPI001EDB07E3|nr:JAB domain-containing protein [Solitalea lacus]UKJ07785.1 JAB domain-containing protein [Solitalea lacus]
MKNSQVNTISMVSEISLRYNPKVKASDMKTVHSSKDAYTIFKGHWDDGLIGFLEEFKILLLKRSHKVIGIYQVSLGGVSGTVVDAKIIFAAALLSHASAIILCHNHPSGTLSPSQQDIQLTKQLKEAGRVLNIEILDHLIITSDSYYSFGDEGLL